MGKFKFQDDHRYAMPAHFGGNKFESITTVYKDCTNLIIQYKTDPDLLDQYIPEALELTDPTITVAFVMNRGVEWMAGGVYNLVAVNVPVRFDGKQDHVEGGFALVVWETRPRPSLPDANPQGFRKSPPTFLTHGICAAITWARPLMRETHSCACLWKNKVSSVKTRSMT